MPQSVAELKFLAECLKGNQAAMHFVQRLFDVFHFWDDLIDRDKAISDEEINRHFYAALVELPLNRFYRAHLDTLLPLVVVAIHNWRVATDLERGSPASEHDLQVAFVLRSSYVDILVMCCNVIGGPEWAQMWAPRIRSIAHGEGFQQFKDALIAEHDIREGIVRSGDVILFKEAR